RAAASPRGSQFSSVSALNRRRRDATHRPPTRLAGSNRRSSRWNVDRSLRPIALAIAAQPQITSAGATPSLFTGTAHSARHGRAAKENAFLSGRDALSWERFGFFVTEAILRRGRRCHSLAPSHFCPLHCFTFSSAASLLILATISVF